MFLGDKLKLRKDLIWSGIVILGILFLAKFVLPFAHIAKKTNCRLLLAPRGEINTGAFSRKYKKLPYIWLFKCLTSKVDLSYQTTCEEETNQIKKYLCKDETKIYHLDNIPSYPSKQYVSIKNDPFRIVFFSRIVPKKNLKYVLESELR